MLGLGLQQMNLKGHNSVHLLCGDSMLTYPIYLTWIWETEGFRIEINYFNYQQNTRNGKLIWTQEFLLAKHYFQRTSTLFGNSGNPELIVKACVLFSLMGTLTLQVYLSFSLCFSQRMEMILCFQVLIDYTISFQMGLL